MGQRTLKLIAEKHNDWVNICRSFGCSKELAEDITQEMYIKLHYYLQKNENSIMYGKEINYYFVFKALNSIFIDVKRKGKNISFVPIENLELDHNDINYQDNYLKVQEVLSNMYWYDRKVYEIIDEGESIAELSRKSLINYYSLYNTYNKVKKKLKDIL